MIIPRGTYRTVSVVRHFVPSNNKRYTARNSRSLATASLTRRKGTPRLFGRTVARTRGCAEEQPAVLHLEEVGFFIRVVRQFCSTRAMVDKFVAFANFLTEGLHDRTRHPDRAERDLQDR